MSVTKSCSWGDGFVDLLSLVLDRVCSGEPSIAWHTDDVASEVEEHTTYDLLLIRSIHSFHHRLVACSSVVSREHVAFRDSQRSKLEVVLKVVGVPRYSNEYVGRSPSSRND
jgi:hypothetical protein